MSNFTEEHTDKQIHAYTYQWKHNVNTMFTYLCGVCVCMCVKQNIDVQIP